MNSTTHLKVRHILPFIFLLILPSVYAQVPQLDWAHTTGGRGGDETFAVLFDASENLITAGAFSDTTDFDLGVGIEERISAGSIDIFVRKLDIDGNLLWVRTIGGQDVDYVRDARLDAAGNIYVTGVFSDTVDFNDGPGVNELVGQGGYDIFVLKLDPNGDFLWVDYFGTPNNELIYGLAVDPSGNVLCTGTFSGTLDVDPGSGVTEITGASLDLDIFVLKLDTDGDFLWAKSYGQSASDVGSGITTDNPGNVYVCGYFQGMTDFDPSNVGGEITSAGNSDIFILKLDPSGAFQWVKHVGGSGSDIAYRVVIDNGGNVLATGIMSGTGDYDPGPGTATLTATGYYDAILLKLDAAGNFVWVRSSEGTGTDVSNNLTTDAAGNVYTAGYFEGVMHPNDVDLSNRVSAGGSYSAFFQKWSVAGNLMWARKVAGQVQGVGDMVSVSPTGKIAGSGGISNNADFDPGYGETILPTNNAGYDSYVFVWKECTPTYNTLNEEVFCTNYTAPSGVVFDSSGTYVDLIANSAGCDSIITINLIVHAPHYDTLSAAICQGDHYTFEGTNYTNAGTYTASYTTAFGCDSLLTLILTVNPTSTQTISATICANETYSFDGQTLSTSGTYTGHFFTNLGCDSTVTLELTVNPIQNSAFTETICQGATYDWNGTDYTSSGDYTQVFQAINGCDSTVILSLIVTSTNGPTTYATFCSGQSYNWEGTDYFAGGTYTATLQNSNGCDSVLTLELTEAQAASYSFSEFICAGSSYNFNGVDYSGPGTYTAYLTTVHGCDSVVTLYLGVNMPVTNTIDAVVCAGESYTFNGIDYSTAGTYTAYLTGSNGCDSTVVLNLTIYTVDVSVTAIGIDLLQANLSGASYRWLNCPGYGFTGQTSQLETFDTGYYAVEITVGSCVDTSDCYEVVTSGLNETSAIPDLSVYPVPTNDELSVIVSDFLIGQPFRICDESGKTILEGILTEKETKISMTSQAAGVYFLFAGETSVPIKLTVVR